MLRLALLLQPMNGTSFFYKAPSRKNSINKVDKCQATFCSLGSDLV
jgi:hypothetical protein